MIAEIVVSLLYHNLNVMAENEVHDVWRSR